MLIASLASACNTAPAPGVPATIPAMPASAAAVTPTPSKPDWFGFALEDARTGATFTMNDFTGKVVLVQAIAEWCPNCIAQQNETRAMAASLGNPVDLVLVTLDVDLHEDTASLKKYAEQFSYNWRFAVSPLEVSRALGNLYSANYLNPPFDPMLIIDRRGAVYGLPFGVKPADQLKKTVQQYLQ
jgi:thiol-disulfide isomerase/thioredoxin